MPFFDFVHLHCAAYLSWMNYRVKTKYNVLPSAIIYLGNDCFQQKGASSLKTARMTKSFQLEINTAHTKLLMFFCSDILAQIFQLETNTNTDVKEIMTF